MDGTETEAGEGLIETWLTGALIGLELGAGLGLGALTCDTLALDELAELEDVVDEVMAAGAGGGGGGGALAVRCAKRVEVTNRSVAEERPESRILHLLPTVANRAFGRPGSLDAAVGR